MALVLVERAFEEPQVFEALQAIEDGKAWCLAMHRVTFLRTYFSLDRRRMVCLYEAPDAEAVRRAQDAAALPYTRIWAPDTLAGPADEPAGEDARVLIVERTFPRPVALAEVEAMARASAWCLEMHRVERVASHLSKDGLRGVCVFLAPDAESVRKAQALAQLPADRVWAAHVKGSQGPPGAAIDHPAPEQEPPARA